MPPREVNRSSFDFRRIPTPRRIPHRFPAVDHGLMGYETLGIVPGHGVCVQPAAPRELSSWRGVYGYAEEPELLLGHIRAGVTFAAMDPRCLLAMSGGVTRATADLSEAESYYRIARSWRYWGCRSVASRVLLERHARDSLGNLVLSLAVFRRQAGCFPRRIWVVGFAFKEARFCHHARAIGWTAEFRYLGINDPPDRDGILALALAGEGRKRRSLRFDPLLRKQRWREQRAERNPGGQALPSFGDVEGMDPYLVYLNGLGPAAPAPWANRRDER